MAVLEGVPGGGGGAEDGGRCPGLRRSGPGVAVPLTTKWGGHAKNPSGGPSWPSCVGCTLQGDEWINLFCFVLWMLAVENHFLSLPSLS